MLKGANRIGKTVLVTGAGRGLGKEMAEYFAIKGYKTVITTRGVVEPIYVAKLRANGCDIHVENADMFSVKDIELLSEKFSRISHKLDILINNAAINCERAESRVTENILEDEFLDIMKVNVLAPMMMIKFFIPYLLKSDDARIINFSSGLGKLSGERPNYYPSYSISKAAINSLTTVVNHELRDKKNVSVFSVDPGWCRTDMGGPNAFLSPKEGIETAVWLAEAEKSTLMPGKFYHNKKILDW